MHITSRIIATPSPTADPRIKAVSEIDNYEAVLVVLKKKGVNGKSYIRDVILRTGSTGWKRAMNSDGIAASYLKWSDIEDYLVKTLKDPSISLVHVTANDGDDWS